MTYLFNKDVNVTNQSEADEVYVRDNNKEFTSRARLKVSQVETMWFSTFQGSISSAEWDTVTSANGTSTLDANANMVNMTVTSDAGSKVTRQTRKVMGYIPSRPATVSMAAVWGEQPAGIRVRHGIFDDENGAFIEVADGTKYAVIRSSVSGSVVETRVPQSQWNRDPLNGTGPSGVTIDFEKVQLINIHYEWYGAGSVEFSLIIDGFRIRFHDFHHANELTGPWIKTPFLPIRAEIENITGVAGTHNFKQLSSAMTKEGFAATSGTANNYATPIAGRSMAVANTYYPMVSLRMKSDFLNNVIFPTYFLAATSDSSFIGYKLIRNGTLTNANWIDHPNVSSTAQVDTSATAISGGTIINEGFIPVGTNPGPIRLDEGLTYQLGRSTTTTIGDTSDIITLAIACTSTNKTGYGSLGWIEQR